MFCGMSRVVSCRLLFVSCCNFEPLTHEEEEEEGRTTDNDKLIPCKAA